MIRFSPETDEDEIHYTLLYAYFSSRKRFGVVANNLKQVKDMYLIPLGAIEKVPHQLVPFDGPGNNQLLLSTYIGRRDFHWLKEILIKKRICWINLVLVSQIKTTLRLKSMLNCLCSKLFLV